MWQCNILLIKLQQLLTFLLGCPRCWASILLKLYGEFLYYRYQWVIIDIGFKHFQMSFSSCFKTFLFFISSSWWLGNNRRSSFPLMLLVNQFATFTIEGIYKMKERKNIRFFKYSFFIHIFLFPFLIIVLSFRCDVSNIKASVPTYPY